MTTTRAGGDGYGVRRFVAASMLACVAYWIARGVGLPDFTTWQPGDASDCAVFTFISVWLLSAPHTPTPTGALNEGD